MRCKNLCDVLQAAEEIAAFTRGMDFGAYRESTLTQRAVERDFEIIGEALNRIKRIDDAALETVSEHHRFIGFRNILIHGHDMVDEGIVWNAVENHPLTLIADVCRLLKA